MEISPEAIYQNYKNKDLNKSSAIEHLVSLIENSEINSIRLASIKILGDIKAKSNGAFNLLENLLLSDSEPRVRQLAAKIIKNQFEKNAIKPLQFAYLHETSIDCVITIILALSEIQSRNSKAFLLDIINNFDHPYFKKEIQTILNEKNLDDIPISKSSEIIINYMIITYFEKKFMRFGFKLTKALVTELDLSCVSTHFFGWNLLRALPEFIGFLRYLEKLVLKINRISNIPNSIGKLVYLKYLDLSNNSIKLLPESIGNLNSLKSLYMRYNNLKELPNSIGLLKLLQILDLRYNRLESLPDSIKDLSSLKVLDLHGNLLTKIPDSIAKLKELTHLELGVNNLMNLPIGIQNLKLLEKLSLGGNRFLNTLPNWIGSLHSLKTLDLYDMNIKQLPETIGFLTSLETLVLRNNHITTIPDSFRKLSSLKKLNLSWNNLTILPEWICSLSSLEELNLWGNLIEILPESIESLTSLKVLNLSFNKLKHVPDSLTELENNGLIIYK